LTSPRCPKDLERKEDFEKMKNPVIHPIYKSAKFQHDCAISEFSGVTQVFRATRIALM